MVTRPGHDEQLAERERLGRRFPIVVVEYDPRWPGLYEEEAAVLRSQFGPDLILRTEHFGSTAVPGLASKPVIDILIEVTSFEAAQRDMVPALKKRGYIYGWQEAPPPGHMMVWAGYVPEEGQKYHVHMAPSGHPLIDRLLFRDYLREHPDTARKYEKLKYELARVYRYDREAYTDAKGEFTREVTERAKNLRSGLLPSCHPPVPQADHHHHP